MQLMRARISLALGTFLLLAGLGISQEKPEFDICKEFLKNSVALVLLPQPFIVREVKGVVLVPYCDDPRPNVLIELRDGGGKFRSTKTDSRGQFKFGNVREGTYTFKITLAGFPSVVGTVVLQKHARKSEAMRIEMPLMALG
jgi:Carboxypeptidase regulatory-like domain